MAIALDEDGDEVVVGAVTWQAPMPSSDSSKQGAEQVSPCYCNSVPCRRQVPQLLLQVWQHEAACRAWPRPEPRCPLLQAWVLLTISVRADLRRGGMARQLLQQCTTAAAAAG